MNSTRVTITDLARSLDLSLCTVSKILNRSFDGFTYSKETIARVNEGAKKMGYRPNRHAQSLRTRKSKLVGLLLPSAQVTFFGAMTDHLELELRNQGYQVLIVHSRNDARIETELIPALLDRGIDGLVWIPSFSHVELGVEVLKSGFPVVILDRPGCTDKMPFVATDNRTAARDLARRIHATGHRTIGILNAPVNDRSMQERFQGICDVFTESVQLIDLPNDATEARLAVGRFAGGGARPTAIVALSETLAIGAIAGLRDLGLRMPTDVSFAAFDDFLLASHWTPRITTVRQDVAGLAQAAVNLLLRRMKSPRNRQEDIRVPAILEWRESIAEVSLPSR